MIEEVETSTAHYKKLVEILGDTNVKAKIESPFDFIHIASKGVSGIIITNFISYFNISREDAARMLNISTPTLYRWIKSNRNLEKNYSILLFELADLYLYGSEVFTSKENFIKWLNLPNIALGGIEPRDLLEMPGGIAKVQDLIGRIEYGVYS